MNIDKVLEGLQQPTWTIRPLGIDPTNDTVTVAEEELKAWLKERLEEKWSAIRSVFYNENALNPERGTDNIIALLLED